MRRAPTLAAVALLLLTAAGVVLARPAPSYAGAPASRPERAAALEDSRAALLARDDHLRTVCLSECASGEVRALVREMHDIDGAVLPALDGAIARLRSGREATNAQIAAILRFRDRERDVYGRLDAARAAAFAGSQGSAAHRLGRETGHLVGTLLIVAGIPYGLFRLGRMLARRVRGGTAA